MIEGNTTNDVVSQRINRSGSSWNLSPVYGVITVSLTSFRLQVEEANRKQRIVAMELDEPVCLIHLWTSCSPSRRQHWTVVQKWCGVLCSYVHRAMIRVTADLR